MQLGLKSRQGRGSSRTVREGSVLLRGLLISYFPEVHIHELHKRVVRPSSFFDVSLLRSKFTKIRQAKIENTFGESIVEVRVLQSFTLEPVDEIAIAGRQTSEPFRERLL